MQYINTTNVSLLTIASVKGLRGCYTRTSPAASSGSKTLDKWSFLDKICNLMKVEGWVQTW